jgi:hypothetical protein
MVSLRIVATIVIVIMMVLTTAFLTVGESVPAKVSGGISHRWDC